MMEFHNEQFVGVSPIQELESLELQCQGLEEQLREKGIKFEDVHPILNNGIVNELDKYLIEPGNAIVREQEIEDQKIFKKIETIKNKIAKIKEQTVIN